MSKPTATKKKVYLAIPEYLVKVGSYIKIGPRGPIPLNYVVEIDLFKDRAVLERIKADPQFAERFTVSTVTPANLADIEKMKTGKVVITMKEAKA